MGNRTRVKVVKNKVAPPFKQAEFDILYGEGISREGSLIDIGVDAAIVRKSGAWYTYDGDQLGQGKENARTFLKDNPDLANEIEKRIKETLGIGPQVDVPAEVTSSGPHRRVASPGRAHMVRYVSEPPPGSSADLLADADPEQVARTILLRRLEAAPRTRHELRTDLLRRGVPAEVADRVLDRFVDVGLIDDAAFAQRWVESRQRSRGTARSVLRQELRAKGARGRLRSGGPRVDRPGGGARAGATPGRCPKLASSARLDAVARTRRLTGMLQRRGYPSGVAVSVVREVLGELPDDEGLDTHAAAAADADDRGVETT